MTMDEPSLSEHEQRILEEIERNLEAEDPDFVRHVRTPKSGAADGRLVRIGILGALVGFGLLLFYSVNVIFGVLGFCVMLGSIVAIVRGANGFDPSRAGGLRDAVKRAGGRMRQRRRDD